MAELCPICSTEYTIGMDGIARCKNGHTKKRYERMSTPTYPLGDATDPFFKKRPF